MGRIIKKNSRTRFPGYSQIMLSFFFLCLTLFLLEIKRIFKVLFIFCKCLGLMKHEFVKCMKSGNVIVTSGSKGRSRLTASYWYSETRTKKCVKQCWTHSVYPLEILWTCNIPNFKLSKNSILSLQLANLISNFHSKSR